MGVDENYVIGIGLAYYGSYFPRPPEELETYEIYNYRFQDVYDEDAPVLFLIKPEFLQIKSRFFNRDSKTRDATWALTPFSHDVYGFKEILEEYRKYVCSEIFSMGCDEEVRVKINKYLDELLEFFTNILSKEENKSYLKQTLFYGKFIYRYFT